MLNLRIYIFFEQTLYRIISPFQVLEWRISFHYYGIRQSLPFLTGCRSLYLEHLLGSLQKLSLRRALQSQMIISGKLIPWLVETLSQPDNLSDYVLEYSAALLMNLCLRTKGRYSLINDAQHTLKGISQLLFPWD